MKRIIAIIMTFALILSSPTFILAAEITSAQDVAVRVNREFGFTYTEQTDACSRITRTYRKQENSVTPFFTLATQLCAHSTVSAEEKTRAVLIDLGMSPAFINELSAEDLDEYANSSQITSVVTYTKTDAEGNVINIPEGEAKAFARGGSYIDQESGIEGGGYPTYTGTNESDNNRYMKLTLIVSYKGGGLYKFSIDSEWLNMPYFRSYDSLGICAYDVTVENNTRAGWISYTESIFMHEIGSLSENTRKYSFVTGNYGEDLHNVTNGIWNGSAVVFHLPVNSYLPYQTTTYSNLLVHYEYEGYVHNLDDSLRFNVKGTYDHAEYQLTYAPTVTLDFGLNEKGIALSLSLPTQPELEEYTSTFGVELPTSIEYNP